MYARPAKVLACPGRMLSALSKQAAASLNMRSLRKVCPSAAMVGSKAARTALAISHHFDAQANASAAHCRKNAKHCTSFNRRAALS